MNDVWLVLGKLCVISIQCGCYLMIDVWLVLGKLCVISILCGHSSWKSRGVIYLVVYKEVKSLFAHVLYFPLSAHFLSIALPLLSSPLGKFHFPHHDSRSLHYLSQASDPPDSVQMLQNHFEAWKVRLQLLPRNCTKGKIV